MAEAQTISNQEFGRRLSAARGYGKTSLRGFANSTGLKRGTLEAYERGAIPPLKRTALRDLYADEFKLPQEFFVIDFNALPEMVAAWRQVQDGVQSPEQLIEAQERDEAAILPPDPSESRTEGQEP